ncbi:unnamed protein product [Clonostachys rosea]|uniref:DUF7703 domain-containing protein n=1 Tax=Bionectria ochroleuca TaxID=29856 RepID=A0ABY6UPL4_BIOOC|nr:unnamed protein product [Clonostachys rosea]
MYNSFELLVLIFMNFQKRAGLYFWSIFLASFGILPYCVGWLLHSFELTYAWLCFAIDSIGWVLLVSGHSLVLYSRLHLVLNNRIILRSILGMIIVNGVVWHTTITVLLFGSTYSSQSQLDRFNSVFNVLEKVQMTFFCLQEFIISGLYIWKTLDILRTAFGSKRSFMWKLFLINLFIVIMDIGILAVEYKSMFLWQQGVKVITYSIKLKLEFAVLGQLIEFVQHRGGGGTSSGDPTNHNTAAFVEISSTRTQRDKKGRSMKLQTDEAIQMKSIKPGTTTTTTTLVPTATSSSFQKRDQIMVTKTVDVERHPEHNLENGETTSGRDSDSTDQLYDSVIQEISRH